MISNIPNIFGATNGGKVSELDESKLPMVINSKEAILNLADIQKPKTQTYDKSMDKLMTKPAPKLNMQNNPFAALTGNINNNNYSGTNPVALMAAKSAKDGNRKTSLFDGAKSSNQNNKMALMLKDKLQTKIQEQNR